MVFLKNALMCTKKVKLIDHDSLPISMLLYIMLAYLCCLLLYLMLFACIMFFVFVLPLIFTNASCFHALSWFVDT